MAGFNPTTKLVDVVSVLALSMLLLGYLLRTGGARADRELEASTDSTAG